MPAELTPGNNLGAFKQRADQGNDQTGRLNHVIHIDFSHIAPLDHVRRRQSECREYSVAEYSTTTPFQRYGHS